MDMNLKSTDLMAASQSRNSAGQTSGFAAKFAKAVAARVDVISNTATVQFFLESSNDNARWAVVYATQPLAAGNIGNFLNAFPVHEGYVRVRWTITGGAATFSVKLVRGE